MYKETYLDKTKFIIQLMTATSNFHFFTKSRNLLSKSTNISRINNNHSITSYQNHTLTNISNSLIKRKKSFSIKKINNIKVKMKKPSSKTKKQCNNQSNMKSFSLRNNKNNLHKIHFNTEYDYSNITQTKLSTETSATSKRHNPTVNLSMLSLSKLKQAKKINSLRNTCLRLHKKSKEGISIISEESAFTSKNNSYNKTKNKTNSSNSNQEKLNDSMNNLSLTYSEDTVTRRKLFDDKEEKSRNNVNQYEDFQTFCNNIRQKLFGINQI